jgi:hypothetical protein
MLLVLSNFALIAKVATTYVEATKQERRNLVQLPVTFLAGAPSLKDVRTAREAVLPGD